MVKLSHDGTWTKNNDGGVLKGIDFLWIICYTNNAKLTKYLKQTFFIVGVLYPFYAFHFLNLIKMQIPPSEKQC